MIAVLDGWQLAACVIAAVFMLGFILVLIIMREGRSKKLRVGMFVEREYEPEETYKPDTGDEDTHEWPKR